MLPRYYRFKVLNAVGQTILANKIKVTARRWKIASGARVDESSEASLLDNGSTLATGAYVAGTTQDNGTDGWFGGSFTVSVEVPASSSGDVTLFFERSTDNSIFDDDGGGTVIKVINFTTSGTKRRTFSL
jgi:hypothetical protein